MEPEESPVITHSHTRECPAFHLWVALPSDCTCRYVERMRIAELEARVRELEAEALARDAAPPSSAMKPEDGGR